MNVLAWHVHGSWMTAFVQGRHRYLVPVVDGRGPDGLGRARTWDWPPNAEELSPDEIADSKIDVVILQRRRDAELYEQWTGRSLSAPGGPAVVWVEHDTPLDLRHPGHQAVGIGGVDIIVHVTHFNALMWACDGIPTRVIEHGVIDPGHRYTGDIPAAVAAINEPVRRCWVTGTDLLRQVQSRAQVDLFGMCSQDIGGSDVVQADLHRDMAQRRVYLHPFRWTSLGLTLIEAMHLGMPVVVLAATEAPRAVPRGTGVLVDGAEAMTDAVVRLLTDREECQSLGEAARRHALANYSLAAFLERWDAVLADVVT